MVIRKTSGCCLMRNSLKHEPTLTITVKTSYCNNQAHITQTEFKISPVRWNRAGLLGFGLCSILICMLDLESFNSFKRNLQIIWHVSVIIWDNDHSITDDCQRSQTEVSFHYVTTELMTIICDCLPPNGNHT